MSTKDMRYAIKPGYGFWDITHYPIGGCFRRAPRSSNEQVVVAGVEVIGRVNGCNRIGTDSLGQRIAFDFDHAVALD